MYVCVCVCNSVCLLIDSLLNLKQNYFSAVSKLAKDSKLKTMHVK